MKKDIFVKKAEKDILSFHQSVLEYDIKDVYT